MPSMGLDYNQNYYNKNKEYITEYVNKKLICEICNCETSRANKMRHEKSPKHKRNKQIYELEQKNIENKII